MKGKINPFHLIMPGKSAPSDRDINRIFGKPFGVSDKRWPRRNCMPLHHILTLSTEEIYTPGPAATAAISIFNFLDPNAGFGGPNLLDSMALLLLTNDELAQGAAKRFPKGYKPWWSDSYKNAKLIKKGVTFSLKKIEEISEADISDILNSREEDYCVPSPLKELEGEESFVGGFPLWVQEDETPIDTEGNRTFYLLMLNGYNQLFERSLIGLFNLYLFLDKQGNAYWVGQD